MLENDILNLLERYTVAFNAVDAATIAEMYHAPSMTVRADGSVHVFESTAQVRSFMESLARQYQSEGNEDGGFDELSVVAVGGQSAVASLRWTLRRSNGASVREWRQTYNLIRVDGAWKFLLTTVHRP
ncbi:MAG: nuclear transport factor 2 family protein [Burkholderiaceae bacterium]